jgi:hypothetical protein
MNNILELARTATKKWLSFCPQKREIFSRLIILLPFCIMIIVTGLNFRLIGDEGPFTIKVVEKFSNEWPLPNILNYRSSTPPLPYLMFTVFGKIIGFEIWKLRLLTVFLTFFAINLFYDLCKQHKLPSPLLGTLSLLFFPYIFFHGFTVYTVCFALFFEIVALKYYLIENPTLTDLVKGSIAATLAIYCRQEYLALPVGILLYELFRIPKENLFSTVKSRFLNWFVLATPLILILPLFILWQGTTPPQLQVASYLTIVPQHLNFFPILVGFYFFPILLNQNFTKLSNSKLIILIVFLVLTPVFIIFPFTYSDEMAKVAAGTGIIPHGIDLISQYLGSTVSAIVKILLWLIGILLIIAEVISGRRDSIKMRLFAVLTAFIGLITLTPYVAERYYVLAIAPLILIFYKSQRNRSFYLIWLVFLILLSAVFSYWQIHLKSFENW